MLDDPRFWIDRIHPQDKARVMDAIGVLHEKGQHTTEYRFRRKDGTYCWLSDGARLVRDSTGLPHEIVGYSIDISDRKVAEKALQAALEQAKIANEAKSRFLASMGHELRTPLNAVIGFSEMIDRETFGPIGSPRYKEFIRDISGSASHLLKQINDILDFAELEAGHYTLSREPIMVREVVRDVASRLEPEIEAMDHALVLDIAYDLPRLFADARTIRQVVRNLLSNAIKFTPHGGRIRISAAQGPDGRFAVSVQDSGIGMSDDDINKAFEPFAQIDDRLSRRFEGTGLGLPQARAFVELHGGELLIESAPGRGTTVTAVFPVHRDNSVESH